MGQYFNVSCLDKKERCNSYRKLGEIIYAGTALELVHLLTKLRYPNYPPFPFVKIENYETKELSFIERMSNDILDRICLFLYSDEDVLQFALSCYRFLEIGRRGLYMRNKISKGSWAGERIITVGDYAYNEYPENVLTEEETEIMKDKELYDYTYEFKDLSTCYCCSLSRKSREAYGYLFEPVIFPTYTEDSKFVLFDITANQYVRASSIPDKHGLNFGHIVLLQTCWSTDPSVTINCEEVLNRGPWAGHRLEITTIDCIDKDAKDVSEEVVNKVVGVFDQDDYTPFKWHCQSYPHILRPPPI